MDTRALFALCLVGIMLVAFGCTGSNAGTPPAQTPSAVKPVATAPTPAVPTPASANTTPPPAPVAPPAETPKETAPAAISFVNSKCTMNTADGDIVMLFKDISHFKSEISKDGKLLTTMWTEGTVLYTLPAGQASGIIMNVPQAPASTGAGASDAPSAIPAGVKYSCVPAVVGDADVTHPAGTTFTDLSAMVPPS